MRIFRQLIIAFALPLLPAQAGAGTIGWPAIYVNHVYVTPDAATYDAIKNNATVREEFGATEERTTVRTDKTYTGLYFYGSTTYFEIMRPIQASSIGITGIGFSIDNAQGFVTLQGRFEKMTGHPDTPSPVTREAEHGKQVPWFSVLGVPSGRYANPNLFVMAYDPRFLRMWYPNASPTTTGTNRAATLDRYVAKIEKEQARNAGLLADVEAIDLSGPPTACDALQAPINSDLFGMSSCLMSGVKLRFSRGGTPQVFRVYFQLKHDGGKRTLDLGTSTLHISGSKAEWTFLY